jgi:hypothetical protein
MKIYISFMLSAFVVAVFATDSSAGVFERNCQMCHGIDEKESVAKLSKDGLLKKFRTIDELVAGAKAATDTDMESIQNDTRLLKEVAADIGLK